MTSFLDILVWSFAVFGVIAITVIILYYISKYLKNYKPPTQPTWPDEEYMQNVGAVCPTGWVYLGDEKSGKYKGKNMCQNYYNVPVGDKCYDNSLVKKVKYFDKIYDWQKCQDEDCKALKDRCKWIKKCGPVANVVDPSTCNSQGEWTSNSVNAPWIGVSDKC